MPLRKYVYAESFGMVYRFTPRNWQRMLRTVAADRPVNYDDYGRTMLVVDHNITDLDPEMAQGLLDDLKAEEAAG